MAEKTLILTLRVSVADAAAASIILSKVKTFLEDQPAVKLTAVISEQLDTEEVTV